MKLTKAEIKEAVITIYTKLVEGQTDIEIADEMGLSMEEYIDLKRAMFEVKADEARTKPIEHVYVEYMIEQLQNIRSLSDIISKFEETKQYTAVVGAIRTRAELTKSILKEGQDFGIIHKEPDKKQIVAGIAVGELTNEKLKKLIIGEIKELSVISKAYVDQDISQVEKPNQLYFEGKGTKEGALLVDGEAVVVEKEREEKKEEHISPPKEKPKRKKVTNINIVKPEKKKKKKESSKVLSPLEAARKAIDA